MQNFTTKYQLRGCHAETMDEVRHVNNVLEVVGKHTYREDLC